MGILVSVVFPRSLYHRGPDSDCFPSGPAPLANVSKPLPPVPVSVSSQEDRLPLLPPLPQLPDQDENYVTPIEDFPAAEYVNQDGKPGSRHRCWEERLLVTPCDISLLQCLPLVIQSPQSPRSQRSSQQNPQSHRSCPNQVGL